MTDSTSSEWRQEGEGPHPTLAGNRFDPNVGSDATHQEGIDHIKSQIGSNTSSGVGSGVGSSTTGTHDTTSGLTSTDSNTSQGGIVGTVKSYLGLGGQPSNSGNVDGSTSASGLTDSNTSSGLTGSGSGLTGSSAAPTSSSTGLTGRDTEDPLDRSTPAGTTGSSDTTHGSMAGLNSSQRDPIAEQGAPRSSTVGGTSDTMDDPTTSGPPSQPEPVSQPGTKEEIGENMEGGSTREHEAKMSDAELGSKRNNEDSIPTAGGERLGQKHWGESKIVPDNPKPASEAGVSSSDGQPTDQVRDNTNANTGGAKPPGSHSHDDTKGEGKEKLTDKIKHSLHIGKKE